MDRLFDKSSFRYTNYHGKGIYCTGDIDNCSDYISEGATFLKWNKKNEDIDYNLIKDLYILPSINQMKNCEILPKIEKMKNLHFLYLTYPYLLNLLSLSLPEKLIELYVGYEYGMEEFIKLNKKDIELFHIKKLTFSGDYTEKGINSLLSIPNVNFPNLEILSTSIDKKGKLLELLQNYASIDHLELYHVGNLNVFEYIPDNIHNIGIIGGGSKFKFENLITKKNIETIFFNDIKSEIDCSFFKDIINLKEINLLNIKKIINIESLAECKNLKNFYSFNCKSIKDKSQMLKKMSLDQLEII